MPRRRKLNVLNDEEQTELYTWLIRHNINPIHIRREFTDVQPTARLLLRYYPDVLDINYYPRRNSVQSKISNWELFNDRVLAKLGVKLTRNDMEKVSRSTPGSIDVLLFRIMKLQNCQRFNCADGTTRLTQIVSGDTDAAVADLDADATDTGTGTGGGTSLSTSRFNSTHTIPDSKGIVIVKVARRFGNIIKRMPRRMVTFRTYIDAVKQLKRKESTVRFVNQKIAHLENLLEMKLEYIDELRGEIARINEDRAKFEPKIPTPDGVIYYLLQTKQTPQILINENNLHDMPGDGIGAVVQRDRGSVHRPVARRIQDRTRRNVNRITMASNRKRRHQ